MKKQELLKLKAYLCDMFINTKCELDGIYETIKYLDLNKKEYLALGFDEEDINYVLEKTKN